MGSEREDEFDADRDEDREHEAVERVREPSPFQVANLHPMPRAEGRVLTRPLEHAAYQARHRQPDEEPVDWSTYVVASDPGPMAEVELAPGPEPEAPNRNQDRLDPEFRERSWNAYSATSLRLEAQYKDLGVDHADFMNAQNNEDLQALGFVKPSFGWQGTAAGFADQQKLVEDVRLGGLFRANGALNTSSADAAGIATAHAAFDTHGTAKEEHDATIGQDHALSGAKHTFDAALSEMRGSFDALDAARTHVRAVKLEHQVAEDQAALEELKTHAEDVHSFLELTFGGALKYMVAGPEEVADTVEALGVMVSHAVSLIPQKSIETAEKLLQAHTVQMHDAQAEEARLRYAAAKHAALAAVANLSAARQAVLAAMSARQKAYVIAGKASANASGGDSTTKARIASIIAAIPFVETVLGLLRKLDGKIASVQPAYSDDAGVGFAMAMYAQRDQVPAFVRTLGHVAYLRDMFADATAEWNARLANLQRVRSRLGGERAATT